eukprot:TRINITY_DN2782_c0_g1_i2.p1 TRINITY_DN2782_c0_g1~~TRINITY_DN2782_c0_g1_i2.p1  ORF type:complete len:322 (-),score=37.76 TRINITY_DN2782_c0_g1_i2:150-1094(-)
MSICGKNICTTGLSGEKNAEIARKCAEIGAFYDANFTENTDFLIAECGGSQKYIAAMELRIPTLLPEWLFSAEKDGKMPNFDDFKLRPLERKHPNDPIRPKTAIFDQNDSKSAKNDSKSAKNGQKSTNSGLKIAFSGLSPSEKAEIRAICDWSGTEISPNFDGKCAFLVVGGGNVSQEKLKFAREKRVPVRSVAWLRGSVATGSGSGSGSVAAGGAGATLRHCDTAGLPRCEFEPAANATATVKSNATATATAGATATASASATQCHKAVQIRQFAGIRIPEHRIKQQKMLSAHFLARKMGQKSRKLYKKYRMK